MGEGALLKASLEELTPVGNAGVHEAAVNVVELVGECPFLLNVIDLQSHVGWDAPQELANGQCHVRG